MASTACENVPSVLFIFTNKTKTYCYSAKESALLQVGPEGLEPGDCTGGLAGVCGSDNPGAVDTGPEQGGGRGSEEGGSKRHVKR